MGTFKPRYRWSEEQRAWLLHGCTDYDKGYYMLPDVLLPTNGGW